ncbi:amino acid ABC transporter permease [Shinella yambaruensis]|uniref:ABC transporter permease n=1 Tax=Shinella yambaruensis TaxID=415996 RepID=A0ABQ5ZL93_9HYPH|nr:MULTISPECIES: amino acid ABC transporter permease [Shinella]CAI0336571.1 Amino acid ABC transporter membrane protein 1 (PAAT family) [Rhizobiaceae bacterium]CAK7255104.1 polar amino acid transport system permease protein [Shinella sp. WSC3-e]MCJ8026272.1 amino acid ABC transporter permease [Shinella yambaruensis]MCO5136409.1 amino acid ABC transporter permease [Shinella sp.]MCU7981679.1 amino acid ABC transporter permease [Shinella yambaruensis]
MTYQFDFGVVLRNYPILLEGTWLTIRLSITAMVLGLLIALAMVLARRSRFWGVSAISLAYVEIVRNTPFLVQIFLLYFGLPTLGIRMSPNTAAVIALSINVGAYATEIIRGGVESISKGQIEAGLAIGLRPLQVFRYVIFKPAMRAIYPALTSQFILIMLTSSVVASISANELTYVAQSLETMTFRSFEIYFVVTIVYLILTFLLSRIFDFLYGYLFSYPTR